MADSPMDKVPLHFGSPEDFARVVAVLRDADFTEASIIRTLKLNDMSDLGAANSGNTDLSRIHPALALFIRIFLFFESAARVELESLLGRSALESFIALDILRPLDESGERYYTSVFLYPVCDLYIASDRPVDLKGFPFEPDDWVFPAVFEGTLDFLRLLVNSPVDDALDLCSGSGIAALVLSRSARRAVAVEIAARATHFARFNRSLNACDNVEVLQGDLYGAAPGRTFDRIVAHPPTMPTLPKRAIFRDGGETGEYLVRRIVEGLPGHLRRGGTYLGLSLNIDTGSAPFEERVRRWLGPTQHEFDLVLATSTEITPESVVQRVAERDASADVADLARMRQALESIDATRFVYGALMVRRRKGGQPGEPYTLRIRGSDAPAGADLDELLRRRQGTAAIG